MDLVFRDDANIQRAVGLYQSFGPPGAMSRSMAEYPWIYGKYAYDVSKLNYEINMLPEKYASLFAYLFNDDLDNKIRIECARLTEKMQNIIFLPESDPKVAEFAKILNAEYVNYRNAIRDQIKSIFGFGLPDKLYVVLNSNLTPYSGNGCRVYSSTSICAIGINIPIGTGRLPESKEYVFVLIHELLHVLIAKHVKLIRKDYFEEALLDYFVPHGIITNNIDRSSNLSIEESFRINAQNRPYSIEISKKLMPVIKTYLDSGMKISIWQFLKENGFEEYLDTDIK